tara:strand:- start:28 stop:1107 length:1080 start_codon:yes stop_codon:yes gene_type:complete
MASSYTTSYGIEKIGSGEQSGAWGTTTNHNLDILDRIAAYKSVALSGSTHTLTVREASPGSGTENLQDGMFRVIKFTGALGANNTVTIAPNTTAAYFLIINSTTDSGGSGPYSVILTQGSGANVTIANGFADLVYCDGAGGGAVVYSFFASKLTLGGFSTAAATITGGSVTGITDLVVADGGTGASTFTDGGVLLGNGTGAIQAMAVLTDGQMIVGDGTTDPVAESGATLRTSIGVAIGSDVAAYNADTLFADVADNLTAGFSTTVHDAGTKSSGTYTPDQDDGNIQKAVNGGAHTLAPTTDDCAVIIQYTNNASAGTITTSGFTLVDGDDISTTNGDDFFFYLTKANGFSLLTVKALQ